MFVCRVSDALCSDEPIVEETDIPMTKRYWSYNHKYWDHSDFYHQDHFYNFHSES